VALFLNPSVLRAPTVQTLSETSNDHALYSMLNNGNTLVQLLCCLLLCSCQLESTIAPTAQLLLLEPRQGNPVRHHLQLLNVFERISRPSCEPLHMTDTSYCKQGIFLYEYPLHWFLLPTKTHNRTLVFGRTLAILTTETSLWIWASPTVMKLDCAAT
jgi:hypothetical protein